MITKELELLVGVEAESEMLNMIHLIVGEHDCDIVGYDFATRIISISGDKENEHFCDISVGNYIEHCKENTFTGGGLF